MTTVIVALEGELSREYFENNRPSSHYNIVYSGVGKVNASIVATQIQDDTIINYGTAGIVSNKPLIGKLVEPDVLIQRDMLAMPQAPRGVTPFEDSYVAHTISLGVGTNITLGTGDSFVSEPDPWFDYASIDLVDMEGYAIAKSAYIHHKKFYCVKYVSDFADEDAAETWEQNQADGRQQFMEWLRQFDKQQMEKTNE